MGKAKEKAKPEAEEPPPGVYDILPKELSELNEVRLTHAKPGKSFVGEGNVVRWHAQSWGMCWRAAALTFQSGL